VADPARLNHSPLPDRLRRRSPCSAQRTIDAAVVDDWCAEFARTRDPALRERIATAHEWLVGLLARKMRRRDEQLDDLIQVASIGLLNAIDRFDPTFEVSFHTYASTTILGELRRHYRSTWRVRVPRRMQERHLLLNHATEHLTGQLRRAPTATEIAEWLELETHEVIEAMAIGAATWIGELDELDAVMDDPATRHDDRLLVSELLARLPHRDQAILMSWLVEGLSQQEIGQRVGLTQVQVSRAARRSLNSLRSLAEMAT